MTVSTRKTLIVALILLPFIVGGTILYRVRTQTPLASYRQSDTGKRPERRQITEDTNVQTVPEVIASRGNALPATFPTDLITEPDLVFKHSFRQDFDIEGYTLASVKYESAYSLKKNIDYFTSYLDKNHWEVLRRVEEGESVVIDAIRGANGVSVAVANTGVEYPDGEVRRYTMVQVSYYAGGAAALKSWVRP